MFAPNFGTLLHNSQQLANIVSSRTSPHPLTAITILAANGMRYGWRRTTGVPHPGAPAFLNVEEVFPYDLGFPDTTRVEAAQAEVSEQREQAAAGSLDPEAFVRADLALEAANGVFVGSLGSDAQPERSS